MLTVLFFSFPIVLQAQSDVLTLSQIDDLIDSKDYNAALKALAKYIEVHPKEFDNAQKRIKKIIRFRNIYNDNASKLVEKMYDETSTDEEKMHIIIGMEQSEENRGAEAIALTNDARRSVALQYYIARSNSIMKQCSDLVAQGENDSTKYDNAVNVVKQCLPPGLKTDNSDIIYYEGMEIPVEYDADLKKQVEDCVNRVKQYNVAPLIAQCENAYKAFVAAARTGNEGQTRNAYTTLQSAFNALAQTRNALYAEGEVFAELDRRAIQHQVDIQRARGLEPTIPDTSYVTFGKWAVLGIADDSVNQIVGADTGIIGSIDAYWNTRVESMKNEVATQVKNGFNLIVALFPQEDLFTYSSNSQVQGYQNKIVAFADVGRNIQNLHALLTHHEGSQYKNYNSSMNFAVQFASSYQSMASTVKNICDENLKDYSLKDLNFTQFRTNNLNSIAFYKSTEDETVSLKNTQFILNQKQLIEEQKTLEFNDKTKTTSGVQLRDLYVSFEEQNNFYDKTLELSREECVKRQEITWNFMAKIYSDDADRRFSEYTLKFAEAKNLAGVDGSEDLEQSHRPSLVMGELTNFNSQITSSRNTLTGFLNVLNGGLDYRSENSSFDRNYINIENVIANLSNMINESGTLIAECQDKLNKAKIALGEAENFYSKAVRDLNTAIRTQNNDLFNSARDNMNNARKFYNDSFVFEDDPQLKDSTDKKLAKLDEDINDNQQVLIVTKTRELKTEAREAYYNGNFDQAERDLALAKNLWAITNGDELDRETEDLLIMVNKALTMKTGRTIPITAPLYPEMSQILNIANQYYDEGAKLQRSGNKKEAENILNQAKEKLRILQIVYPLNQDASILTLKIDRLLDEKKFDRDFSERVNQALKDVKVETKQLQAYAELEDLHKINPNYPGLAKAIIEAEYELGFRSRPVTDTNVTRSQALYSEALRIYNSSNGNQARMEEAVARLDEAIRLNPRNRNATSLKDRISSSIGGRASSVLSAQDSVTYRQIIQVMNNGNLINALSMTEQLMAKGNNSRNKQLQDLRNRIRGLLGMS